MRKRILIFTLFLAICGNAFAITRDAQLTNTTPYNYNYMYPYMNNQMRTNLNPGVTTSQSLNPINTVVRTIKIPSTTERRVVPRTSGARAATTARVGTTSGEMTRRVRARGTSGIAQNTANRRVVARSGTYTNPHTTNARATTRSDPTSGYQSLSAGPAISTRGSERASSTRCLADYSECMNRYCERPETKYNRCYCSAKLSQIDSKYQTEINDLINQIIMKKNVNQWSNDDMNEYWMSTIGKYSDTNSWENLDNALNIDWASTESRVRGQNAFVTGHEYCSQHLRGCSYMTDNIRNAYSSEIARDCQTYEQYLQNIRNAADSIVKAYK